MQQQSAANASDHRAAAASRYRTVRNLSETLAEPLSAEDRCVQSMADASPTKWHLGHTTWFFETLVLLPHKPGYAAFDERFFYLFNSYYEGLGPRHPRPHRGLLTRPGTAEVAAYRAHVDRAMTALIADAGAEVWAEIAPTLELGLHHEQQHQELILTDVKHLLSCNPLLPAYRPASPRNTAATRPHRWIDCPGGIVEIGHAGDGFAFDNEAPRHEVLLRPFRLASRPVTCGEYLAFMQDDGYRRPELWLSEGWTAVQQEGWQAPAYWRTDEDGGWQVFTMNGQRRLDPAEPVTHVSLFEAAAFANWTGKRLPTEFEWEAAAAGRPVAGNLLDAAYPHPRPAGPGDGLLQLYGDVWEWTRSSYDPYPGFRTFAGPAAEYNGKFMVGQLVLRGGSCATPEGHIRPSYRNFFPPNARWQFSGIRLVEDV